MSGSTERQESDANYIDPEPGVERLRDADDTDNWSLEDEAKGLLDNLPAHRVMYHPTGDLDLEPLRRVGDLADVFVLCDWRWPRCPDGFDATIGELLDEDGAPSGLVSFSQDAHNRSFEVPTEQVQAITGVSQDFGLFHEPAWVSGQQPWGRITRLRRCSGDVEHPVWVVHLVGNAVEVYQNLFLERGATPRVLWLDPPLGADLDGWGKFTCATGEFGHVFVHAAHQPEFVAAQRYQPGWKHTVACQRLPAWHPSWDMSLFALPGQPMDADEGDGRESR